MNLIDELQGNESFEYFRQAFEIKHRRKPSEVELLVIIKELVYLSREHDVLLDDVVDFIEARFVKKG